MRCLRCIFVFVTGCLGLALLAGLVIVLFLADWMVRSDDLQPSDSIVVLAGAPERALYAGDLYLKQYAPIVLVSRPARHHSQELLSEYGIELPRYEDLDVALLRAKRVPEAAIEIFGNGSLSTVEEMEVLNLSWTLKRLTLRNRKWMSLPRIIDRW